MEDIRISLDTSGIDGEISVVRVDGVIDTMTATELEKVMNSLLDQKRYNIIIDLGGVDYISSAGWGIFISNIREIRQNAGDIKLARMVPNVREIFELLEFDSILQSFDNVEKAKHKFNIPSSETAGTSEESSESSVTSKLTHAGSTTTTAVPAAVATDKRTAAESLEVETSPTTPDLKTRILELVREDPFYSISEMKRIVNSENSFDKKVGWWRIRSVLKNNGLGSRKKRFRYARTR